MLLHCYTHSVKIFSLKLKVMKGIVLYAGSFCIWINTVNFVNKNQTCHDLLCNVIRFVDGHQHFSGIYCLHLQDNVGTILHLQFVAV